MRLASILREAEEGVPNETGHCSHQRMAIRAAVVATAAVVVSRISILERPYWIVLTSVLLIYETAGESIKRRSALVMTLAGCLTGWLLYTVAGPIPTLRWTILLGGVFDRLLSQQPARVVYAPMIFFASVYVVFGSRSLAGGPASSSSRAFTTRPSAAFSRWLDRCWCCRGAGHLVADDPETFWESCVNTSRRHWPRSRRVRCTQLG